MDIKGVLLAGGSGAVTFAAGVLLGVLLSWSIPESLLLGTLFVSTSTTIALKMMEEIFHETESKGIMIAKTAIVVDDLYGFIALALVLTQIQSGSVAYTDVAISIGKVLISIIVIFSVGIFLMPKIFIHIEKIFTGSSFTFGISFYLILSYAVISIDLSPLIGAFLAGTILTATMQYKDVLKSIIPIRNLFATVFFVTIGLVIDPTVILSVLPIALLISIVAIFFKNTDIHLHPHAFSSSLTRSTALWISNRASRRNLINYLPDRKRQWNRRFAVPWYRCFTSAVDYPFLINLYVSPKLHHETKKTACT